MLLEVSTLKKMQTNVGEETVRAPRSVPQPFSLGNRERLCRLDGEERRRVGPAGSPSTEGLPSAQLGGLLAPEGPSRRRPAGPPAVGGGLQLVRGLGPGGQEGGHSTDLPAHLSPHTHTLIHAACTHTQLRPALTPWHTPTCTDASDPDPSHHRAHSGGDTNPPHRRAHSGASLYLSSPKSQAPGLAASLSRCLRDTCAFS